MPGIIAPIEDTSPFTTAEITSDTSNLTDPTAQAVASLPPPTLTADQIFNPPTDVTLAGSLDSSVFGLSSPISSSTTPTVSTAPPIGGVQANPAPATAQWTGAQDLRAKLRVPTGYIQSGTPAAGPNDIIKNNGGILFPFTPVITMDNKAEYTSQTPLHSNFAQYFYKNSSVGPISIQAKFTVQNETEGAVLLGVIHLLRALTKMRFGDDPQAGSPPPVCRLDAYGDYMLHNVPVAITSWRQELSDGVDYIAVGQTIGLYGHSMVPVLSTIQMDLNIMYSRNELLQHNVPSWLTGALAGKGYL